ncbi:MAG: threonine/serine exporter family protein [Alphaproteobacteria bacterium]
MTASAPPADALDVLVRFGAAMLQAGNTAFRTRKWIDAIAPKLGFETVSIIVSLDSIAANVRHRGEWLTAMRQLGPPGINVSRIAQLEQLARTTRLENAPADIAAGLADIESASSHYSIILIAAAVGLASGGFAFLSGGGAEETVAAAMGGGAGQWLRSWLTRRRFNQYGTAALSAILASGLYVLIAAAGSHFGLTFAHYPAGFIASILFLVPGFPLIAALFDLLQYHTVAAVSRFAYGVMMLLAVAFGLSIVVALAGVDVSRQPPLELTYALKLLFRAVASFVACCAFAMVFNSPPRMALAAGLVALAANDLRLILIDMGMMLAPAAFFAALLIGLIALATERRFTVPPMAVTVAPIVIMIPGLYAFEMIVLFNRGQMLEALQASASCFFVIGALAMGLAVARIANLRSEPVV